MAEGLNISRKLVVPVRLEEEAPPSSVIQAWLYPSAWSPFAVAVGLLIGYWWWGRGKK